MVRHSETAPAGMHHMLNRILSEVPAARSDSRVWNPNGLPPAPLIAALRFVAAPRYGALADGAANSRKTIGRLPA